MIKFVYLMIIVALSIGLGIQLSADPGYVLIATRHWTLETTILVALIGIVLVSWLACQGIGLFIWFIHLPNLIKQGYERWLAWIKRKKMVSKTVRLALQKQAYLATLSPLVKDNKTNEALECISALPGFLKKDPDIIYQLALFEMQRSDFARAESMLRRCITNAFNVDLIGLYSRLSSDVLKLDWAESLLNSTPDSAELYLCLGHICYKKQLWGKARLYFEKSIEQNGPVAAYLALGELVEFLGDLDNACKIYHQGLSKVQ